MREASSSPSGGGRAGRGRKAVLALGKLIGVESVICGCSHDMKRFGIVLKCTFPFHGAQESPQYEILTLGFRSSGHG